MAERTFNCPNCGSALTYVRFDNFLTCRYCRSKIASFPTGSTINLVDITDSPSRVVSICEELIRSKRYRALKPYSEILIREQNFNLVGKYYKSIAMLAESDKGFLDFVDQIIIDGNEHIRDRIFRELPAIYVDTLMAEENIGPLNQPSFDIGYSIILSFRFADPSRYDIDSAFEFVGKILDAAETVLTKEMTLNGYYKITLLLSDIFIGFFGKITGYEELCKTFDRVESILRKMSDKLAYQPYNGGIHREDNMWETIKNDALFFYYAKEAFSKRPSDISDRELTSIKEYWDEVLQEEFDKALMEAYLTSIGVSYSEFLPFSSVVKKRVQSKLEKAVKIYFSPAKKAIQ